MNTEIIRNLANAVADNIISDLRNDDANLMYDTKDSLLKKVLDAYNMYCEDERDGVGYIFNLDNQDDLMCCIKGGMTAQEVAKLYDESQVNTTKYFYLDELSQGYVGIANDDILITTLCNWMEDVVFCVVAYPWIDAYRVLYTKYVCDYMIEKKLVS